MGILNQAVKTYDFLESINRVGVYTEGEKEPLAPISHITTKGKIEITIGINGEFVDAAYKEKVIIIPVTEKSSGRSGPDPAPHPLCDKLEYILKDNKKKNEQYMEQLREWVESEYSNDKLNAIYKYLMQNNVKEQLEKCGLLKKSDDIVYWNVIGTDVNLYDSFINYYLNKKSCEEEGICYVTGENAAVAKQHIGGIVSFAGRAKLISTNDESNFVFLGRFINSNEALSVSYITSQKAHNVLKWIVANQRKTYGNRTFICWNPNGKKVISPASPLLRRKEESVLYLWKDYKKELENLLYNCKIEIEKLDDVVIAGFEAATQGRLSLTYYNELKSYDYFERLKYWDETCCWNYRNFGISSPYLNDIVDFAYGNQKSKKGKEGEEVVECDNKIKSQYMQRLIYCRIEKQCIPKDIFYNIITKAEKLLLYNKKNREKLLFIACSVIRKYIIDYKKEECLMEFDRSKKDRSYQYGRLLAILEKIENDTYDNDNERTTNALRMQSIFVKRPAYASKILIEKLKNSYYSKLHTGSRIRYEKMIGEIYEIINEFGEKEYNKPLSEMYLIGYYLQKNELYKKKESIVSTENEEREE